MGAGSIKNITAGNWTTVRSVSLFSRLWIFLCALATPCWLDASDEFIPLKFKRLDVDRGLPDQTVNHIMQDRKGFIWFGTTSGISRFDGREYLNFRRNIHQPDSLSSNAVNRIFHDRDDTIWVATADGLNALNPDHKGFRHFFHEDGNAQSLLDNLITDIVEDAQGRIWVGSGTGVQRLLDKETGSFKRYDQSPEKSGYQAISSRIWRIFSDDQENLWLATLAGLFRYDFEEDAFKPVPIVFPSGTSVRAVYSLYQDDTGILWMGTNLGLAGLNVKTQRLQYFPADRNDPTGSPWDTIQISEDTHGMLWLGNFGNGLTLFERRTRRFRNYRRVPGDPMSLPSDAIRSVFRDNSGLMWVGTMGWGVGVWNPLTKTFLHYTRIPGNDESLNHEIPWGFSELQDGSIWIATDAGLNRWRYGSNTFESIVHDPNDATSITPGPVYNISPTHSGLLWMTAGDALNLFDTKTLKSRRFFHDPEDPKTIPAGRPYSILAIDDQRVWAAMVNQGFALFDAKEGLLKHYLSDPQKPNWLRTNNLTHTIASRDGHIWIASANGLYHFDQEKEHFTHYPEKLDGTGLSHKHIFRIYEDERGHLWAATNGGGVSRVHPDGKVTYYTTREGIANDIVLGICEDRANKIWMTTVRGITRLDPETGAVRTFDVSHGLQSNEFNEGALYIDKSGRLYAGGGNGFNVFDPDDIVRSEFLPPIHFTAIRRFGKDIVSPFQASEMDVLPLSWRDSIFSLQFVSLDYAYPQGIQYMYKLEGFSDEWIQMGNRDRETFTNLGYGTYVMRVKGTNSDGRWSDREAVLRVDIATPPFLKPMAILAYVLTFFAVVGLIWHNQRKRTEAREAALKAIRESEERLKHALWGTGDELWNWDITTNKVHRSNMLDVRADDHDFMDLDHVFERLHPEDFPAAQKSLKDHVMGEAPYYEACYRIKAKDGSWVWVMDRGRVVERDASGKALRMAGTNKNITSMKQTEENMKLIAKAFENTSDGVIITDPQFKILTINPAHTNITGFQTHDVVGSLLKIHGEKEKDLHQDALVREALAATGHWSGELWLNHKKGGRFPVAANLDVVRDQRGQTTHVVCVVTDISFLKKAEERMQNLANYDQLTSLPNRNLFQDRLSHALSLAQREKHLVALLFLDLDRFKNINDSLGHAAGDQLLQAVADRVRRSLREVDSVARLGGDEFTVILEGINTPDKIAAVAEKVLRGLDRAFILHGQQIVVTPSIGISVFPNDGEDTETLLKCADTAMYHAKKLGGNTYQFFTSEMNRAVVEKLSLENDMRRGLEEEEFVVYYQPKFETERGHVTGLEALVRWQHPTDGMVSPGKFIPVAEETGLIVPLGLWVMRRACEDAASWLNAGIETGKVAVNLSALQFRQSDLVDSVAKILEDTGLPPDYLELEITEGTLLNNIEHAIEILLQFRALGLSLALDDFGTGFSSLGYLKRLPIQTLKIDRSFVRDVTEDPEDASIVTSIIDLAHNLNLSVVAEGVETEAQLAFLQDRGCELVQGFLFAKPMPLVEVTDLLSAHANLN